MKSIARHLLKSFCSTFSIRGRHRLVNSLGKYIAPSQPELLNINGMEILLDHSIETCRYMYYGMYEEKAISFLTRILRPTDIVIEPGANIGYMTAQMLGMIGPKGHIYALEPSRRCLAQLEESVANADLPQLTLLPVALAHEPGRLVFNDTPRVIARGYATLDIVSRPEDSTGIEVEVVSIDIFCAARNIDHVRFLKLDIEGAELLALKGSQGLLSSGKIDYILVETTCSPNFIDTNTEIINLMNTYDYHPHQIKSDGRLSPCNLDVHSNMREDIIWCKQEHYV